MDLFQKAADRGSPEGYYYLGMLNYSKLGSTIRVEIQKRDGEVNFTKRVGGRG